MAKQEKRSGGIFGKFIIILVIIVILALGGTGVFYYLRYFGANVSGKQQYLYIHTGETYSQLYDSIRAKGIVNDTTTFNWAAHNMKYVDRVKPGKYRLHEGESNHKFIRMLELGEQEHVVLSFHPSNSTRTKEFFAGFLAKRLEPDSLAFLSLMDSTQYISRFGFNTDNVYTVFIPNSYEIYWNTSPDKFFQRMYANYQKFWTPERKQKAADINLSPIQVSILASIVDAEALHDDEMPTIAGLYLNRLKKGMLLQSDPTVIFAVHDFTIHRVLNKQLAVNSPYNTYQHTGLPPGPVMMPSVNAINSVLDYKKSDYIYMCAKEDFSGYHNFTDNEAQHHINARKFQAALDARNIKK
jgi:UPF0755 protein